MKMSASLQSILYKTGYYTSLSGAILILLWTGIFKFTLTEANAIKPLMENSPFTSWMYKVRSVQRASNIIGVAEMATAIMLILSIKRPQFRWYAALAMTATFLVTLSFLFTTPGTWKMMEGLPVTNFFILKDLVFLGFG